jgi:hypothetical protein
LKCRQKHLMQPDLFFVQQPISFSCFVLGWRKTCLLRKNDQR